MNKHVNSLFNSVSYRLGGILVDPGDEWEGFENVDAVLLTHAHFDHIYGLNRLMELNPAAVVYTNQYGLKSLLDDKLNLSRYNESPFSFKYPDNVRVINDGDEIISGNGLVARAMFTPGHNGSCITWIVGERMFTGDSYIPGVKVVTNLPGGKRELAERSLERIHELEAMGVQVFPGHSVSDACGEA